jgi:alanyl-tRNA synthetase
MTSQEIRKQFIRFFESKDHKIVPSAPIVVKNDPTLMFTNAGMNQFKDYFLGNEVATNKRIADSQKCLRVSGKHNDLEEVGVDTYHHTMFEMLGNWSFGDYFKEEAIAWAWELLTEVYKLDKSNLYVTVFAGDENDGLKEDIEAKEFWKKHISEDRILSCGKKDNFWEMGDTGPCGPCSEIHIDLRSEEEKSKIAGKELVNADHPQVIEIWNLVFIEFNRNASGKLESLPAKHVDTGMGFERLTRSLQGKTSNYDTDIFTPLINQIETLTGLKYSFSDSKQDIAFRVIADHVRAVSFTIADGQLPSNTGAGYVIRRILRRAIRYAYSFLNVRNAFIFELVQILANQMGEFFPEIVKQKDLIAKIIKEEEESFLRTLERGINRFNEYNLKNPNTTIDGMFAFELYDTFGFPLDLTVLMANEIGKEVDLKEFDNQLKQQKERSKNAAETSSSDWVVLSNDDIEEFVGYDILQTEVKITKYREVKEKNKTYYQLVFNMTPFYPEGGGQVGDKGYIKQDNEKVEIFNTLKENNLIIHLAKKLPSKLDGKFLAVVNEEKREATQCNHSATHLLHQALREVLGTHVEQKGSLVNEEYLRFDFSHFQKVSDDEIAKVEQLVNQRIRKSFELEEKRSMPHKEALEMGAMALFGEKYGDTVRVIKFGESVELCGGTHVKNTSQIGLFKIVSEGSVAAGIRRVEAITGQKCDEYFKNEEATLQKIKELLKNPQDVLKAITALLEENQSLSKQLNYFVKQQADSEKKRIEEELKDINDSKFYAGEIAITDAAAIKDLAFQLKNKYDNLFLVLGNKNGDKVGLTIAIGDKLSKEKDLNAGKLIRDLAKHIQGGGGGQPTFATAGGKDVNGLGKAFESATELIS